MLEIRWKSGYKKGLVIQTWKLAISYPPLPERLVLTQASKILYTISFLPFCIRKHKNFIFHLFHFFITHGPVFQYYLFIWVVYSGWRSKKGQKNFFSSTPLFFTKKKRNFRSCCHYANGGVSLAELSHSLLNCLKLRPRRKRKIQSHFSP